MAEGVTTIGPQVQIAPGTEGTLNESTPMEQRIPTRTVEMSDGPRKGPTDNFLPARYKIEPAVEVAPGVTKTFPQIVEDR